MPYLVRDYDPEDPQDAWRLAEMFNDFDAAWPGGFTRGLPETEERIRERKRINRRLAMCVVEYEGELVGYADLDAQPGQSDEAYLPLLGARLGHHGKGVGKMLLREIIRRTTERGYRLLTLDTWAGNMKAVPLYKKTGFNWVPETSVLMRNFLPSVLTCPAGRAFFANREWYDCYERELDVAPDSVKWNGMKVYPYRFRDGDEFLNLTFDAASDGLTALETPEYSVACYLGVDEAPAGETFPLVWEIEPRNGQTLDVVLLAEGDPDLEVKVQERLTVTKKTRIERPLRIASDAKPRRGGEKAHRIHSTLLINGEPVQLETGAKIVRPVEIQYRGEGLFPGRAEMVRVRMRSRLDRPVEGTLAWDAHSDLTVTPASQKFNIPPKSWTQCDFEVTAQRPGTHSTSLRYEAGDTRGGRSITFRAFGSDGVEASIDPVDDESAVLQSPNLRAIMQLRNGGLQLHASAGGGHQMAWQNLAELGPPFMEFRSRHPLHEAREEQGEHGKKLVLVVPSVEHPGLVVERSLSFLGGDVMRVDYDVRNTTGSPLPATLRLQSGPNLGGKIVLPTKAGLIREPLRGYEGFPDHLTDALAKGETYAESWVAMEEDGFVCGMIWDGAFEEADEWNRFPDLTYSLGEIAPNSLASMPPVYLVGGGSDWKTVRGWWRRLAQPSGVEEDGDPETIRVLEAKLEPSPALWMADRGEATVVVENRRGQAVSGSLMLRGEGLEGPQEFPLEAINRDHAFSGAVSLPSPTEPSAIRLTAEVDTGPQTDTFHLPVIRIGTEGNVALTERDGLIVADNGWMTLRVAPGFLGSLVAMEREGVNHLLSAYPETRPFVWFNPWHGGVHPFVGWIENPRFNRSTFTGEPVERTGERGLRWSGVKVATEPEHKDLQWLRLEVEYLTLPGSNVVALVTRWINRTAAHTDANGGFHAWVQPGGRREHGVHHWEREGERRHRRQGGFQTFADSGPWATVENAKSRESLALISSDPRVLAKTLFFQEEGSHLEASGSIRLGPHEAKERLSWLVLMPGMDQIDAYASLAKVQRLP